MRLWEMYLYGQGVQKDNQLSYQYLQLAAEQGHPKAQYELGNLYDLHVQDKKKALFWYTKAAKQGYPPAQYNIGVKYAKGEGVEQNDKTALIWYEKAANKGDANAQYNLGAAHQLGQGVPINSELAISWFRKAAIQGHGIAQYNIGAIYLRGGQVQKDYVAAYAWLKLSIHYGAGPALSYAKQAIESIKTKLSVSQYTKAEEHYRTLRKEIEKNKKEIPKTLDSPNLHF